SRLNDPMNRRDFLAPRRLARSAGHVLGAIEELQPQLHTQAPVEFPILRFRRRAMATDFEVAFPLGTSRATAAAEAALDEIDRLQAQLTVYRADSELCRLNQQAATDAVAVEQGLFELLELAVRVTAQTGGAFDISAGALVKAWGFFRGPPRVPAPEELREAR